MSKYYRDAFFDLRTSVDKQVAISYLLGLRSFDPVRPNNNPKGDPHVEQGKYLAGLDRSVFDEISDRRDNALNEVDNAIDENDQVKKAASRIKVTRCDDLMRLAHRYLCDINYELAKGDQSMLKVDHVATPTPQDPYIEVASLDEWATKKYEINIFKTQPDQLLIDDAAGKAQVQVEQDASQVRDDVGKIKPNNDPSSCIEDMGAVKADNVLTFMAFLIEEYCKLGPPKVRKGDKPNASGLGNHFESLATAANNKNELPGLDHETIRKLVTQAKNVKIKKLTLRG